MTSKGPHEWPHVSATRGYSARSGTSRSTPDRLTTVSPGSPPSEVTGLSGGRVLTAHRSCPRGAILGRKHRRPAAAAPGRRRPRARRGRIPKQNPLLLNTGLLTRAGRARQDAGARGYAPTALFQDGAAAKRTPSAGRSTGRLSGTSGPCSVLTTCSASYQLWPGTAPSSTPRPTSSLSGPGRFSVLGWGQAVRRHPERGVRWEEGFSGAAALALALALVDNKSCRRTTHRPPFPALWLLRQVFDDGEHTAVVVVAGRKRELVIEV